MATELGAMANTLSVAAGITAAGGKCGAGQALATTSTEHLRKR